MFQDNGEAPLVFVQKLGPPLDHLSCLSVCMSVCLSACLSVGLSCSDLGLTIALGINLLGTKIKTFYFATFLILV